eukprot:TRINITY_DN366_c0_g1_i1.p1 TRINITY_DN366_c0_g1~~TRINITY_DN366_c0_g1_i1.p1  ORF type:complete len:197 (-),score=48.82 TRINITY_DN366_c0_g1_i1:261-851(-)
MAGAAEANRKAAQSATDALWDKVRHSDSSSHDVNAAESSSALDTRPLHERLAENQAKAASQREEQFLSSVFQAPRIYSDEEFQFLADQQHRQRLKEKQLEQEVDQFNAIAQEIKSTSALETDSTLKLIAKRKKAQESTSLFGKQSTSPPPNKKRPSSDAIEDIAPDLIHVKKVKSVEDESVEEVGSLASLIGYTDD